MMFWCRFQQEGRTCNGVIEGERIREVQGDPFSEHRVSSASVALGDVKLLVPVVPATFYATGSNYRGHIEEMAAIRNKVPTYPDKPLVGYFSSSALVPTKADIIKPADSGPRFQYEGELVAVFGKTARRVSIDEALDCVFGWTIGNDISSREWQETDRFLTRAKCTDTFKPMGPWIVTDPDLDKMVTTIRHNGKVVSNFKTSDMIFSVADYVVEITKYMTIHPGDILWLGTNGSPGNLNPGDTIEVEISQIGLLSNRVVAEQGR